MKVSEDCVREMRYPFKIETIISKYNKPTIVQFDLFAFDTVETIAARDDCSRIKHNSFFVMESETAVILSLIHGDEIVRVDSLNYIAEVS